MKEKRIHQVFEVSIFLKALHAVIEICGGVFFYLIHATTITLFLTKIAASDLAGDPHDTISHLLLTYAQNFSVSEKSFVAFYLLSHGVVKLIITIGLLLNKRWAYPSSLVVLGMFMGYQLYRFIFTHSPWLMLLTLFDVLVFWLIWHEYRLVREGKPLE